MKLSFSIKKPADVVLEYLTDMQKYVSVHPVITQIDNLGNDNYLVHETLKLGPIPFSFTYPVSIQNVPHSNVVVYQATVLKITKIEMTFKITRGKRSTVIEENLKFKSPLPIKSIMENIFRKQHRQLFRNIEMLAN
jgi:carbon monoxide dehydrogenase subunit G